MRAVLFVVLLLLLSLSRHAFHFSRHALGGGRTRRFSNRLVNSGGEDLDLDFDLSEGDFDGVDFENILSDKNFWKEGV